MSNEITLTEIQRTPVNASLVRAYRRESQHTSLAFDLLRETSLWTIILGSAYAENIRAWNVREAVLGGHLLRLGKLLRAFLEQTGSDRGELAWVSIRLVGECTINLRYLLLTRGDQAVIESYVFQSLQHEQELQATIEASVQKRNGVSLPIEERMLRSIARAFRDSGVDPKTLPAKKIRNWGNKNLRQKAAALGLEEAYRIIIAGASRNVHGSWQDLLQHHLEVMGPTEFEPRYEDAPVRPQALQALALLVIPGLIEYVEFLSTEETERFTTRLLELEQRVETANRLHEEYLVARQSTPSDGARTANS